MFQFLWGEGMSGLIDTFVKASVIVAVAVASTAVAYHYLIYIPQRDAALDEHAWRADSW